MKHILFSKEAVMLCDFLIASKKTESPKSKRSALSLFIIISIAFSYSFAIPTISNVLTPTTGSKYEKFEVNFNLNNYINPYDPDIINVYAEFWGPNGQYYKQFAFFYEGHTRSEITVTGDLYPYNPNNTQGPIQCEEISPTGINSWKIRFSPNQTGTWKYRIIAKDQTGTTSYPTSGYQLFSVTNSSNKGPIRLANNRYLKFDNGTPYYPIGISTPFYARANYRSEHERGFVEMKQHIDEMSSNGMDFFRYEVNYFEATGLIGWDFKTEKNYCRYFNQRKSWQLDKIVEYAQSKGMHMLLALFAHSCLGNDGYIQNYMDANGNVTTYGPYDSNGNYISGYCGGAWSLYHPFNEYISFDKRPQSPDSRLNLQNPYEWYSNEEGIKLQKKLLRYIIARWGYSSSILGYELMDEADRLDVMNQTDTHPNWVSPPSNLDATIILWHKTMTDYLRANDPYKHLITTAYSNRNHATTTDVYKEMDFTQVHRYMNYNDGTWLTGNTQEIFFNISDSYRSAFDKPYMIGEFNYVEQINVNDPNLYNTHDVLWASMHDGSMAPASMWSHVEVLLQDAAHNYTGISQYVKHLPQLSKKHHPSKIEGNGFRMYYLKDNNNDEYIGWVQDINFTFRNLFENYNNYLTNFNPSYRPPLSSWNGYHTFPVSRNGSYKVKWYNTTTGALYSVQNVYSASNQITISMPSLLRQGTHADAAFIIEYNCSGHWNTSVLNNNAPNNKRNNSPLVARNEEVFFIGTDNRIHHTKWNGFYWEEETLKLNAPQNVRGDSDLALGNSNDLFFVGTDNRIHLMYWDVNSNKWHEAVLNASAPQNVRLQSSLVTDASGAIYFIGNDARIHRYYWDGQSNSWQEETLKQNAPQNVLLGSDLAVDHTNSIFFAGTDRRIHIMYMSGANWEEAVLQSSAPQNVRYEYTIAGITARSPMVCDPSGQVYFVANDNRIHNYYWAGSHWQEATLKSTAPQNVRAHSDLAVTNSGQIYFIATDNKVHQYYYSNGWHETVNDNLAPSNIFYSLTSDGHSIFYGATDHKIWSNYWGCNDYFKSFEDSSGTDSLYNDDTVLFNITVFPNPNKGEFTLKAQNLEIENTYRILNLNGQVIQTGRFKGSESVMIKNAKNGFYLLELTNSYGRQLKKILIN